MAISQPIIRGIQAVGAVQIMYRFNGNGGKMTLPKEILLGSSNADTQVIDTSAGVMVSGFRLDGEFLRAVQQIASSVVIPILGGGGVALTNNNRTGSLTLTCAKVSTPNPQGEAGNTVNSFGAMYTPEGSGIGIYGDDKEAYDLTFLAQVQQAQVGGDSAGATLDVIYNFCDQKTIIEFQGCTVASVDPIGLSGNDAATYSITYNYLNWVLNASAGEGNTPLNSDVVID